MTTASEQWQPKGILDLEPAAWHALRHAGSACVVAGPGAGKSEFLAQKAAYLLETGICPPPFRILAISFKKDAAENLVERVKKRCKPEHASRFDSYTFDAFTKGLVDRFQKALPQDWRLLERYDIINFNDRDYDSFLSHHGTNATIQSGDFKNRLLATHKLSLEVPSKLEDELCRAWFRSILNKGEPDFQCINRLAEWIIRSAPAVKNALQQTYPFVFIDEFQDTTYAQYDFLYSLFYGSQINITTVGDDKQKIMTWAGAKPNAFQQFEQDFRASQFKLLMNYRSSPGLVAIQRCVALSLDPNHVDVRSEVIQIISDDFAKIWAFRNWQSEYEYIASWIVQDMAARNLQPKDYAILVKQRGDTFYNAMAPIFLTTGLTLRNEVRRYGKLALQDIASDEVFLFITNLLHLSIKKKAPAAWTEASEFLRLTFGEEDQSRSLERFLKYILKPLIVSPDNTINPMNTLTDAIVNFLGIEAIKGMFPRYASGNNLEIFLDATKEYLNSCLNEAKSNWPDFLKIMDGVDQIPLLTIHKSKGLEYDTVLLLGLDDESWWSYSPHNLEGNATFFVALSRAKQRIIFTHSKAENCRQKVSPLYDLLKKAGVTEIVHKDH